MRILTTRHESALGCWTLSTCRPPELAGLVAAMWCSQGTTVHPRERAFPNGGVQLKMSLGEPYRRVEESGTTVLASAWLSGLQWTPQLIEVPARHRALALQLTPIGAYALLARPMHEISGRTLRLGDLVGRAADELVEQCRDAASDEDRLGVAAAWVSRRLARAPAVDRSIAWCAARIASSGGTMPIAALRAQTGLTAGRLAAAFRAQIGVTPKLYARVARFRRLLSLLHRNAHPLVEVALAAGYFDQPHMNAEFRALSGLTPRAFLAARYPDGVTAFEDAPA